MLVVHPDQFPDPREHRCNRLHGSAGIIKYQSALG